MPRTNQKQNKKNSSSRRGQNSNASTRLSGDGKTFTLDFPIPRPLMTLTTPMFTITQSFSIDNWFATNLVAPAFTNAAFSLANFNQVNTLVGLFDQYRINDVEIRVTPHRSASVSNDHCLLASVLDFDDATNLTSFAQAEEYSSAIVSPGTHGHIRRFKPHCANALYSGAFTSFGNVVSPWIDGGSPSVQHYGVKLAVTVSTISVQTFSLTVYASISFRNSH